jgi:NCS1 family nucleobase:cation symporter-1
MDRIKRSTKNWSWKVDQTDSAFALGHERSHWTNKDLDPVPPEGRKWGVWSLIAYWISDAFNPGTTTLIDRTNRSSF